MPDSYNLRDYFMRERNNREALQRENEALLATLDEIEDALQRFDANGLDATGVVTVVREALTAAE